MYRADLLDAVAWIEAHLRRLDLDETPDAAVYGLFRAVARLATSAGEFQSRLLHFVLAQRLPLPMADNHELILWFTAVKVRLACF